MLNMDLIDTKLFHGAGKNIVAAGYLLLCGVEGVQIRAEQVEHSMQGRASEARLWPQRCKGCIAWTDRHCWEGGWRQRGSSSRLCDMCAVRT